MVVAEAETRRGYGDLAHAIVKLVAQAGSPVTAAQVRDALGTGLAYTTVMTVMTRLAGKGILARFRSGRRFVYAPVAADTAEIAVRGVLAEFGDAALARFVERAELDPRLRERLRRLMEQEQ